MWLDRGWSAGFPLDLCWSSSSSLAVISGTLLCFLSCCRWPGCSFPLAAIRRRDMWARRSGWGDYARRWFYIHTFPMITGWSKVRQVFASWWCVFRMIYLYLLCWGGVGEVWEVWGWGAEYGVKCWMDLNGWNGWGERVWQEMMCEWMCVRKRDGERSFCRWILKKFEIWLLFVCVISKTAPI